MNQRGALHTTEREGETPFRPNQTLHGVAVFGQAHVRTSLKKSGVDPPLCSSRACIHTAFIAFSVPFTFNWPLIVPQAQCAAPICSLIGQEGWASRFWALSPAMLYIRLRLGCGVHAVFHVGSLCAWGGWLALATIGHLPYTQSSPGNGRHGGKRRCEDTNKTTPEQLRNAHCMRLIPFFCFPLIMVFNISTDVGKRAEIIPPMYKTTIPKYPLQVGTGARCAHGAHRSGQLHSFHPPIGPSQKGTRQQHLHKEASQQMGIT